MIYIKCLGKSSEIYGNCDVCSKEVDIIHIARSDGVDDIFFGHDECLIEHFTKVSHQPDDILIRDE